MARAAIVGQAPPTALVVEDDASVRFGLCGTLRRLGWEVREADSCESAGRSFIAARTEVVVMDLRLPDGDALTLLPRLQELDPEVSVFIITGHGTIDLAVRAVKQGAENFLTKPVDVGALDSQARTAVERRRARQSGQRPRARRLPLQDTRSRAMQQVAEQVSRLRDADCSVLLLGETGTGKSVLARELHALGARAGAPFVEINCAGLAREFVESELFGHERGAFTGAHASKQGLFEAAHGGTLFLDEIGDIDPQVQPKVLKVVEEQRFRRMGDVKERSVDVRLIAATHHDLVADIHAKLFRADLYYRISTVTITLPPLRERAEDVVPLARRTLVELGAPDVELSADAQLALLAYPWPGNLRELKNVLERALLLRQGAALTAGDLRFDALTTPLATRPGAAGRPQTLSELQREHIQQALEASGGRVDAAARRLGISRSTLYQRLKEYGLTAAQLRSVGVPPTSRGD